MTKLKVAAKISVALLFIGALIFSGHYLLTRDFLRINEISIQLESTAGYDLTFPKIKDTLDLRLMTFSNQFIWKVDLEKILKVVQNDLRVKEAKVTRIFPNIVNVTLVPHTPVLNILGKNKSRLYPVARNGDLLPHVKIKEAMDSPILRGENFLSDRDLRLKAVALMNSLPPTGSFSQKSVAEILFNGKKGFQIRLQPSGAQVWLDGDVFQPRIARISRVVDYLEKERLTGRIIDARYDKKIVVKLRNEP